MTKFPSFEVGRSLEKSKKLRKHTCSIRPTMDFVCTLQYFDTLVYKLKIASEHDGMI